MYGLKNMIEVSVMEKIKELQPSVNCCSCEKCMLDVASYALNNLKPRYVVTREGELISKLFLHEPQAELDITAQVIKAFQVIGEHPKH